MTDSAIANLEAKLAAVTARLATVEAELKKSGGSAPASTSSTPASSGGGSAALAEFDSLIEKYIAPLVSASGNIDPLVKQQAEVLQQAINCEREIVAIAASSKKPANLTPFLTPTSQLMAKVSEIRDSNRGHKCFNHLSTLSEGVSALGWVAIEPTPGPFVNESRASSEFYSNRILREFKGKDESQVEWVGYWNDFLKDLFTYIKQYHTTGLSWNPRGGEASPPKGGASPAAPSAPAAPAAPAAPPPDLSGAGTNKAGDVRAALFKEIGEAGDAHQFGLRKVTKEMKTKYRSDKSSVVPASASKPAASVSHTKAPARTKPPVFALKGTKWVVENQVDNKSIIIDKTESKQTVYIFGCTGSVIQVKGKVNAITLDGCKKTGLVFDDAIATVDAVNCSSVQVQVTGFVPNIAIDKCSGCQLYLSEAALRTEIVSSKSSEMNIMIPDGAGDMVELAVPEQFKTTVEGRTLKTEAMSHI